MPTETRKWDLHKKSKNKNPNREPDVLVRQCAKCFKVYKGVNPICPYCGYNNGKTQRQLEEEERAELERIEKIEKKKRRDELRGKSYEELVKIGRERGYKNPEYWARMRVEYREKKRLGFY